MLKGIVFFVNSSYFQVTNINLIFPKNAVKTMLTFQQQRHCKLQTVQNLSAKPVLTTTAMTTATTTTTTLCFCLTSLFSYRPFQVRTGSQKVLYGLLVQDFYRSDTLPVNQQKVSTAVKTVKIHLHNTFQ